MYITNPFTFTPCPNSTPETRCLEAQVGFRLPFSLEIGVGGAYGGFKGGEDIIGGIGDRGIREGVVGPIWEGREGGWGGVVSWQFGVFGGL